MFTQQRGINYQFFIAVFQSQYGLEQCVAFPIPASQKTIQSAKFNIMHRTGSYSGNAVLTLEIFDYAGNLQHTVSTSSIDMQAATPGIWTNVNLSGIPADLTISPGEFLAFRFPLSGAVGGDFRADTYFEVEVQ